MRKEFLSHEKCKSNSFKVCQINEMFGRTDNAHIILGFKVELKSQMAFMRKLKRREVEGNADSEMQYNEK